MDIHLYPHQIPCRSEVNIDSAVNDVRDNFSHTAIASSNVEVNLIHTEETVRNVLFF